MVLDAGRPSAQALGGAPALGEPLPRFEDVAKKIPRIEYSWNLFRYMGDYLHLAGIMILFLTIAKNRSLAGFSMKTQALYFIIFCSRYLDLFDHKQASYLVFFKVTYIVLSGITLLAFYKMYNTYEAGKDTCSIGMILIPCLIAACLFSNEYKLLELAWTYSEFLEGFSMVPQYVFSYRDGSNKDKGVIGFIFCIGSYRVFYACNWIYKKMLMPHYSDIQSWIGGIIEILFFLDFLNYRLRGSSILRSFVLGVDDKVNEFQEKVELKVLGRARETEGQFMLRKRRTGRTDESGEQKPDYTYENIDV